MSTIKVPTNFNIELEFEVPEFHRRMFSLLLDMVVQFFYILILSKIVSAIQRSSGYASDDYAESFAMIAMIPFFLYHVLLEITMNGQSIGKKLMGIRVVNETGGKPSYSQFIIRWMLRLSDVWLVIALLILLSGSYGSSTESVIMSAFIVAFFLLDIILVASTKKGQRLGDILAHTILIKTNAKAHISDTVFQEVADNYVPQFPQVMKLSDRDLNAVKSILDSSLKKGDYNLALMASDKIKNHLNIQSSLSPYEFLEVLLKDYNYLSVK
jgi:uncharacterized RDD family membrane protein YckC